MAIPLLASRLVPWCTRFLDVLSEFPERYRLEPDDLAPLASATSLYLAAQTEVANPLARTGALIKARDVAQQAYYRVARPIYAAIQVDPEITDENKADAGVHVKAQATPIAIPTEKPGISFVSPTRRSLKVRIFDPAAGRRARPYGCVGAYVWMFAGESPPESLDDWSFQGTATRSTFEIAFPLGVSQGSKVWLCAAWVNTRGQPGPVCEAKSGHTPFGGVTMHVSERMKQVA